MSGANVSPIGRNKEEWFVQLPIIGGLNQLPRLRPLRKASRHFLSGRSHPSLSKEGTSAFDSGALNCCFALQCQMLGCPMNDVICTCQATLLLKDPITQVHYLVIC